MMNKLLKYFLASIFALAATPYANAAVTASVSATPSSIGFNSRTNVQLSWKVSSDSLRVGTREITSSSGTLRLPSGSILATVNKTVGGSKVTTTPETVSFTLPESLSISQTLVRKAQQAGANSIIYQRVFSDPSVGDNATKIITFAIKGTGGDVFTIRNAELSFEDGSRSLIAANDEKFRARAVVGFMGSGIIDYSWQLASPPSTAGQPVYTTLISRRQHLMSGDRIILNSPALPSVNSGEHLVRLLIRQPGPIATSRPLRYVVREGGIPLSSAPVIDMVASHPAAGARVTHQTEFSWRPIVGADAYQLEVHVAKFFTNNVNAESPVPIAGILIPAVQNKVTMNNATWQHLQHGKEYQWRVIALNADGVVIGSSPLRSFVYP